MTANTRVVHQPVSGAAHPGLVEDCALCAARRGPATPDIDLPAEAIEAAAIAVYAHDAYTNDLAEIRKNPEYDGWADDYFESAAVALAAALPVIRRHIADELREVRPGLPWHHSREQESFQRGFDAAVAQLDRAAARVALALDVMSAPPPEGAVTVDEALSALEAASETYRRALESEETQ